MKKILIILILAMLVNVGYSQRRSNSKSEVKWLSLAVKGGFGNSLFINSDFTSDAKVLMDPLSTSYFYGGRFGFTYGESVGLMAELLQGEFGQKYEILEGTTQPAYIKDLRIKTQDVAVLFRYTSEYGMYMETGLKFTTTLSVEMNNSISGNEYLFNDTDLSQTFQDKYNSLVFGFGFSALRAERVTLTIGARASYGYSNYVKDPNFFVSNDGVYENYRTDFSSDTNPLTIQAVIDFNYFFAFWGDATCGRKRFMMFQ